MARRADIPACLILLAIGLGLATSGGTGALGLSVAAGLVALAWGVGTAGSNGRAGRALPAVVLAAAFVVWALVTGVTRAGIDATSLRVPVLTVVAVLAGAVAARLEGDARELLLRGVVALGAVHALVAIVTLIASHGQGAASWRAESLLGHPNALGIFLVVALAATARELDTYGGGTGLCVVLVLQAGALLLTGSRLALLVALAILIWRSRSAPRILVTATPFVVAAVVVLVIRFSAFPTSRPRLWASALERIGQRPVAGWGPEPRLLTGGLSGLRPTTQAHNEAAQIALEYGLVGLVLAMAALAAWLGGRRVRDRWLGAAALALVAAGMVDISLRVTPVAVTLGVVAALATTPASTQGSRSPVRGRPAVRGPAPA